MQSTDGGIQVQDMAKSGGNRDAGLGPDETKWITMYAVREAHMDKFNLGSFCRHLQQKDTLQGDEHTWKICCRKLRLLNCPVSNISEQKYIHMAT